MSKIMMTKKSGNYFSKSLFSILLALSLNISVQAGTPLFSSFAGKPVEISDYIVDDKWLLVMIWASDCHICNREAHAYVDFYFKHEESNALVLGVSIDGQVKKAEAELFIKRHEINFPNIISEPDKLAHWFEKLTGQSWMGTPTLLVYSPEGELKVQQIGAIPLDLVEKFIQRESARKTVAVDTSLQVK